MSLTLFDNLIAAPKPQEISSECTYNIEINGQSVPVKILFEQRLNSRVSVSKNGILLRVSELQNKNEQRKSIDSLLRWAKEKLGDKPELLDSLPQRKYMNGEVLKVGEHEFVISIFYHHTNKSTAKIFRNNIVISLAKGLHAEAEMNACSYLVAKCLCRYFHPIVSERLHELNDRFFKKKIGNIKMKYATSFWGHCSTNTDIVISVRLMFAPSWVIDYVLIHELAHLVYHDHSPRFWKLVETVMPSYRNAEKHLKEHSHRYYL